MVSKICLLLIHGNASRQSFLPFGNFSEVHSSSMSEPDKDLAHISFLVSLRASPLVWLRIEYLLDKTDRGIPVISLTTASLIPYPYYIVSFFFRRISLSHTLYWQDWSYHYPSIMRSLRSGSARCHPDFSFDNLPPIHDAASNVSFTLNIIPRSTL